MGKMSRLESAWLAYFLALATTLVLGASYFYRTVVQSILDALGGPLK